ncbi:MAG: ATP-grasp domain, partial [Acidimicrobiales bacterium]|nr:ATP-grasp domain [Acidimicrobiales bacterium]
MPTLTSSFVAVAIAPSLPVSVSFVARAVRDVRDLRALSAAAKAGAGSMVVPAGRLQSAAMSARTTARTLSEADSKALLAGHGVPFAPEAVVATPAEAVAAAAAMG